MSCEDLKVSEPKITRILIEPNILNLKDAFEIIPKESVWAILQYFIPNIPY